jgi:hypothetical protein
LVSIGILILALYSVCNRTTNNCSLSIK